MSLAERCFQQRVLYLYVDGRAGSMRPVLAMLTQAVLEFHISLASVSMSWVYRHATSYTLLHNVLKTRESKEPNIN